MDNCGWLFLDCQGIPDLVGEIFNLTITLIIFVFTLRNCFRLSHEGDRNLEAELEQSRLRKLRINIMCGAFLIVLLVEITYSFSAFIMLYDFDDDKLDSASKQASIGYKIVEVTCINLLNCLIVSVGKIYWRAVRVYLQARGFNQEGLLRLYGRQKAIIFTIMYVSAAVCVAVSAILLVYAHGEDGNGDYTAENLINFIVTLASIIIFVFTRLQYYYITQRNQQISRVQLRKEFFYALAVCLTCILRIVSYWLAILGVDPSLKFRNSRPEDCYDDKLGHAFYIIGLTIFVNLLPPVIFIDIFKVTTNEPVYEGLQASLTEADYNSQN